MHRHSTYTMDRPLPRNEARRRALTPNPGTRSPRASKTGYRLPARRLDPAFPPTL